MFHVEVDAGLVLVALAVAALLYISVAMVRSRRLLGRPGGLTLAVRLEQDNWRLGIGRYAGDELLWYAALRPTRRPSITLRRADLEITGQRRRRPVEPMLAVDAVVVECRSGNDRVSLALSTAAVTGFLSWLESSAPRT